LIQSIWSIFRDSGQQAVRLTRPQPEEPGAADAETSEPAVKEAEFRSLFQTTLLEMKKPQTRGDKSDSCRM